MSVFIAPNEEKSITIYRRFERLAGRNLLYLESELAELEAKQDELDKQIRDDMDRIVATRNLQQIEALALALRKESRSRDKKMRLETVSESIDETSSPTMSSIGREAMRDLELNDKISERLKVATAIRKALREYCK